MVSNRETTISGLGGATGSKAATVGISETTWQRQAWHAAAGAATTQSESKVSRAASRQKKRARKSATLRIRDL